MGWAVSLALWAAILGASAPTPSLPARGPPGAAEGPHTARARTPLPDLTELAEAVVPGVVGILTAEGSPAGAPGEGDPLHELYEHFRADAPRQGIATGFVIDPAGFIVTNAHVVEEARSIQVELGEDDERVPARVVGRDSASDVALLKVDVGRPLAAIPMGDSDALRIAEWVMVVGNPFGLAHTVTLGIVSQVGRSGIAPSGREGYFDFIQTDASINPGNSGGPLVNLRGEVVGIATAVNASGQGIGFAVPINMAKPVLAQLRERGQVVHSWMGVSVRELQGRGVRRAEERRPASHGRELLVTGVARGGPADVGGVRVGDVITGVEGQRISSAARMRWYVANAGVGRRIGVTVRRAGEERLVLVDLARSPEGEAGRTPRASPEDPADLGVGSGAE